MMPTGCALTNKADPLSLRYFAPPRQKQAVAVPVATTQPLLIRVNRVEVAAHLTETIAYRQGESEVGYYHTLRWTEPPDVYLDRAIDDVLFSGNEMRRGLTDWRYTLGIELEAFEELKYGTHRAIVGIYLSVADERMVLRERRLVVETPVAADAGEPEVALANAFGRALSDIAELVRREVRSVAAQQVQEAPQVSEVDVE
jgi:hypothetical protein